MSDQAPSLLICCFDVLPGHSGLSRRVTEYLKGIGDKFQVVVLSNKTPDHSHIERYQGARLLRVPIGSGDLQSRIQAFDRAVRRQLESEEYQIVHFFDPFGGYALCEGREGPQYRLVYDAQTFPSQELRYTHPHTEGDRRFLSKIRRQELFCLMNSDAVITGSEVTRKFILDQGVPESQVRVLRAPVELGLYTPDVLGRPDASPMKVLYLGSQLGYQGLPTLLRAMQLTVRQVDVRLTIVGPRHTEWQAHLSDLVNELKLAGKVEFQPPVAHDDLHKIVATCDLGALPLDDNERNRSQGGPMAKLGEYLAGGRPVIAADLPITRELVPDAAGVFFPCGDFKKLAEQLIELAQNPARRVEMGKAARAAADKIDASWIRGQLLDLYSEVAGRARPPAGADQSTAEITRAGQAPAAREDSSKRRVPKTDPAIRTDPLTDPEGKGAVDQPAILGTPLREEDDAPRTAVTDRVSHLSAPVVMGTPLAIEPEPTPRELPAAVKKWPTPARGTAPHKKSIPPRGNLPSHEPLPEVTPIGPPGPPPPIEKRLTPSRHSPPVGRHAQAEPPLPDGPPEPTPIRRPPALLRTPATELPPITRAAGASGLPSVRAIPAPLPIVLGAEESSVVADDDVEEIADHEVIADPAAATGDESGEVMEADEVEAQAIESNEAPLPSKLDPWLAQLVHGYCPPDAPSFNRHTPPTNFPGRD